MSRRVRHISVFSVQQELIFLSVQPYREQTRVSTEVQNAVYNGREEIVQVPKAFCTDNANPQTCQLKESCNPTTLARSERTSHAAPARGSAR